MKSFGKRTLYNFFMVQAVLASSSLILATQIPILDNALGSFLALYVCLFLVSFAPALVFSAALASLG